MITDGLCVLCQALSQVFSINVSIDDERFEDEDGTLMFGYTTADAALACEPNDLEVERLRAAPAQLTPVGPLGVLEDMFTPGASDGLPTISKGELAENLPVHNLLFPGLPRSLVTSYAVIIEAAGPSHCCVLGSRWWPHTR